MTVDDITRRLASLTYAEAARFLEVSGWKVVGSGDWSLTFGSKDQGRALRVSPFDPAFRLFAELQLERPARGLVEIVEIVPMQGHAYGVQMPLGTAVPEPDAQAFLEQLSAATKRWLETLVAEAGTRLSHFGGTDIHPGNVIYTDRLVLTDPIYLDGPRIRQDLLDDPERLRTKFRRSELEAFCELPFFAIGGEGSHFRESLRDALAGSNLP